MKTRIAVVLVSFLAAAVLNAQAKPARGSVPAPSRSTAPVSHARPTPPIAAPARPVNSTPITRPFLPPGWGLAQGPVSTVNNPGGLPSAQRFRQSNGIAIYYSGYYSGYTGQPQVQVADNPDNQVAAQQQQQQDVPQQTAYYDYPAQYPSAEPNPATEVTYSLLAFKDHSIYAVVDYWLENNKVNYVTNYGASGSVALDKIDIDLTVQLNGERNTKFELHEKQP
jgi:hypothetical protein